MQHAERVQRGAHAHQDQDDGEDLAGRRQRLDLAEADGRDRGDGLIGGIEHGEAEHEVADRADEHHRGEHREGQAQAPPVAHPGRERARPRSAGRAPSFERKMTGVALMP